MTAHTYTLTPEEMFDEKIFDLIYDDDVAELIKHIGDKPFKLEWLMKAFTKDKFKSIQYFYPIYREKCNDEKWIDKSQIKEVNKQFVSLAIIGKDKNILSYLFQFIDINEVNALKLARELNDELIDWLVEQGADITYNDHEILRSQCSETGSPGYQIPEIQKIYDKYITLKQKEEAWEIIDKILTENKMNSNYTIFIHERVYEHHKQELLKILKLKLDDLPQGSTHTQPKL